MFSLTTNVRKINHSYGMERRDGFRRVELSEYAAEFNNETIKKVHSNSNDEIIITRDKRFTLSLFHKTNDTKTFTGRN